MHSPPPESLPGGSAVAWPERSQGRHCAALQHSGRACGGIAETGTGSMLADLRLAPPEHWMLVRGNSCPCGSTQGGLGPPQQDHCCVCSSALLRPAKSSTAAHLMHGRSAQLPIAGNPTCTDITAAQDKTQAGACTLTAGQLGPKHRPYGGQLVECLHHVIHAGT